MIDLDTAIPPIRENIDTDALNDLAQENLRRAQAMKHQLDRLPASAEGMDDEELEAYEAELSAIQLESELLDLQTRGINTATQVENGRDVDWFDSILIPDCVLRVPLAEDKPWWKRIV